jgi:hypothetical protein
MPELIATNEELEVQKTIDEHPEIDTLNEDERGAIIDITALRLNDGLYTGPWGRKARSSDPAAPNLNTDGLTYLRDDGLFEIYDVISGIDGSATWEGYGPFAPGENGFWWPPQPYTGTTGPRGTAYPPYQQPLIDGRTGHVSKPWHLFFLKLGGSGGSTGAEGIADGGVALLQIQEIQSPRLLGRGTSGLGAVEQISLGTGLVMTRTTLSVAADGLAQVGYWTPITNGDALSPEILFDAEGDCVVGFVPTP